MTRFSFYALVLVYAFCVDLTASICATIIMLMFWKLHGIPFEPWFDLVLQLTFTTWVYLKLKRWFAE